MTILNYVMTACFVFSVVVQFNDPDPLRWMAIYGAAATACVFALRRRGAWRLPAAIGTVASVWAATIAPRVLGQVAFGELFEAFEMKDLRVEEARECGGLLIVAVWMAVLVGSALYRRRFSS